MSALYQPYIGYSPYVRHNLPICHRSRQDRSSCLMTGFSRQCYHNSVSCGACIVFRQALDNVWFAGMKLKVLAEKLPHIAMSISWRQSIYSNDWQRMRRQPLLFATVVITFGFMYQFLYRIYSTEILEYFGTGNSWHWTLTIFIWV